MRKKGYTPSRIQDNIHELLHNQPVEHLEVANAVDLEKRKKKKKAKTTKMRHGQY